MGISPDSLDVNQSSPAKVRINSLARWSLILGLVGPLPFIGMILFGYMSGRDIQATTGIICFSYGIPLMIGMASIIIGGIALIQIGRSVQKLAGSGMAVAGLILGALMVLVSLSFIVLTIIGLANYQ